MLVARAVCCTILMLPVVWSGGSPADAATTDRRVPEWATVRFAGSVEALARLAGFDAHVEPARVPLELVRVLHGELPQDAPSISRRDGLLAYLGATARAQASTDIADDLPLPLTPAIWRDIILQEQVSEEHLLSVVLLDRAASLVYYGLAALDADTLQFIGRSRDLLLLVDRVTPGAFAATAPGLRVSAGRVLVPGGQIAEPWWAALVGAKPDDPASFIRHLLTRDAGRLAAFYTTIAQLNGPRLQFALGLPNSDSKSGIKHLRELYNTATTVDPAWSLEIGPFSRRSGDLRLLLSLVEVTPQGRLSPPSARRFWEDVFGENLSTDAGAGDDAVVDAATLARVVLAHEPRVRRLRSHAVCFAQRLFGNAASDGSSVLRAVRSYARFEALHLTLERIGVVRAGTYVAAARRAEAMSAIGDDKRLVVALSQFQGALAVIDRCSFHGVLDHADAVSLVESLIGLPFEPGKGFGPSVADWIVTRLLPPLRETVGIGAPESAEDVVLHALAGARSADARAMTIVRWEDQTYRIDPASAELSRLLKVREKLTGPRLDDGLGLRAKAPDDGLLAGALRSLAYAAHIGDPENNTLLGPNPADDHDFRLQGLAVGPQAPAWTLPAERVGGGAPWHLEGSLLCLDVALARFSLKRLSTEQPLSARQVIRRDEQAFALTAVNVRPAAHLDVDRDRVIGYIERGRQRIRALTGPSHWLALAETARLDPRRQNALAWLAGRQRDGLTDRLTLTELLWVGLDAGDLVPDAWGVCRHGLDGSLAVRFPLDPPADGYGRLSAAPTLPAALPDLTLRLAELTAQLRVPASVVALLLPAATQDLVELARPAYPDDWLAFPHAARMLAYERYIDQVAALTATGGPLVPDTRQ
ncbi:MAG TPA: hypothetical protein VGK32_04395 [Vicinamibacterales bacterium]|jgi:hypothetical protein